MIRDGRDEITNLEKIRCEVIRIGFFVGSMVPVIWIPGGPFSGLLPS